MSRFHKKNQTKKSILRSGTCRREKLKKNFMGSAHPRGKFWPPPEKNGHFLGFLKFWQNFAKFFLAKFLKKYFVAWGLPPPLKNGYFPIHLN